MSKKIYISPSSQTENAYAVGNTTEAAQCRKIALALVEALRRCGFEARTNTTDGKSMYDRVAESNAWGADAHIPIHTNAYNGQTAGFRGFAYNTSGEGFRLVKAIMAAVAPLTPGESDAVTAQPQLYEIKASNAPCAYLELGFHDNPTEAQYIIKHTEELAEAICQGVCAHYGVEYVAPRFVDVPADAWFADAVKWAVQNGITKGLEDDLFGPNELCTRAQVVTFLHRLAGCPESVMNYAPLDDVKPGSYYADAVTWAYFSNIVEGVDAYHFCPDEPCTRAQIVTFLWRYAGRPGATRANPFVDVQEGKFYHDAVLWAVEHGITKGVDDTHFAPGQGATRAQVVTFLHRLSLAV